jgi:hypothetical protein
MCRRGTPWAPDQAAAPARKPCDHVGLRVPPLVFLARGSEQYFVDVHFIRLADSEHDHPRKRIRRDCRLVHFAGSLGDIRLGRVLGQFSRDSARRNDRRANIPSLYFLA